MVLFQNQPAILINYVQNIFLTKIQSAPSDLVIICENGESVETNKYLFSLFSPNLRSVFGSLPCMETITLIFPDIKRIALAMGIKMMMMDWDEEEVWSAEIIEMIHLLGIEVGTFLSIKSQKHEIKVNKIQTKSIVNTKKHQSKIIRGQELGNYFIGDSCKFCCINFLSVYDKKSHIINKHSKFADQKIKMSNIKVNKDFVCCICNKMWSKKTGKRDQRNILIRNHIIIHLKKEFKTFRKDFFNTGSRHCNVCDNTISSSSSKALHLFYHKILNEKVTNLKDKIMKRDPIEKDISP